ncbi:MAG TPA: SCP2 sterol-binding domain-containing protein [Solirubrobacteraceae bacterium]|nr:SCP2 sterol-binding domain-containing protein [Solirubrobacteraceae bacterium]
MDPAGPPLSPEAFARIVRDATDEQLAAGLRANRELILPLVFAQMPDRLDPAAAADVDAVVEWRVGDREDGGHDAWQLTLRSGRATVERGAPAEPQVVLEIGAVDFLRLVGGAAEGPLLFMHGRLRVEGDLVLAVRMPLLFRMPSAG